MAAFADLELAWLQSNGATATNRTDAWKQFLNLQGFIYTTFSDARFEWLRSLGYEGTTQDMLNKLWETCQDFSQPSAAAWIDGDGWVDAEAWIDSPSLDGSVVLPPPPPPPTRLSSIVVDFNGDPLFPQTNSEINVISDLLGGQVVTVDGQSSFRWQMNTSGETGFGSGNPLSPIGDESSTANNKILSTTYMYTRGSIYFRIFDLPPLLSGTVRMTTWRDRTAERLGVIGVGIQLSTSLVVNMQGPEPTTIELPFETSESGVAWFQATTWNTNNGLAYINGLELIFDEA